MKQNIISPENINVRLIKRLFLHNFRQYNRDSLGTVINQQYNYQKKVCLSECNFI